MLNIQIPPKLLPVLEKKKRFKVMLGGRGGCKSVFSADALTMGTTFGERIGCFREFQNSIDDSVKSLIESEIRRIGIPGFNITKNEIDHSSGGCFRFKGLARNPDSIKSMFGFNKFWVEEAQSTSAESLKLLTPTLREDNSEVWLTLNPMSSADPVSQRFIEPFKEKIFRDGFYEDDLHYICLINWRDNPWFPASLEEERIFDFNNLPRAMYDHIWEGAYNDTVENAIILPEWFDAAIDAHVKLGFKPNGVKVASHDPSDTGADAKGLILRHGSVVLDADIRDAGDVAEGMDWALDTAITEQADLFVWDCDGMGVSLVRQVSQALRGKRVDYEMFKGSEGVDHPDQQADLQEQARSVLLGHEGQVLQHVSGCGQGKIHQPRRTYQYIK